MTDNQNKWKNGLGKTRKGIWGRITQAFKDKKAEEILLEELEQILIEGDVGVNTTLEMIDHLREQAGRRNQLSEEMIRDYLKQEIRKNIQETDRVEMGTAPHVILVVGVNGTGKTTTIGKLAMRFRNEDKKVLLAAADTFRAAAVEQLAVWAQRADADLIQQSSGADAASVAYDALDAAVARGVDVLLIDTAGRLHNRVNLMEELKKIHRVIQKRLPSAPHEVLLVLDATTGQNGLNQARLFGEAVGINGIVLTKLDGTARGGIIIAINKMLGISVKWVGVGEGVDDLLPFEAESFVDGIFGS